MVNNLGELIKNYRGQESLREFAKKCGISHTHLDSIEKGMDPRTGKPVSITVETLKKIAKAMNISVNELTMACENITEEDLKEIKEKNIIKQTSDLDSDTLEIIMLLKDLDTSKKRMIINFIKTFK